MRSTSHGIAAVATVLVVLGALGLGVGCRTTPTRFTWGRTPAAGATSTCPDDAVDLTGDRRLPTGDHVRCSYEDAARGQARVSGTVLDGTGPLGNPIEGTEVALVPIDGAGRPGAAAATTRSDPQGGFTLRARVTPGRWAVAAGGALSPPWTWDGRGPWSLEDVHVRVPAPGK
jgi:hypothetical protein